MNEVTIQIFREQGNYFARQDDLNIICDATSLDAVKSRIMGKIDDKVQEIMDSGEQFPECMQKAFIFTYDLKF